MVYCKNCGSEVPTEDVCPKCGTIVETEADVFETSVIEDSSFEAEVYDAAPAVDPGKGKGTAALILGIVSIAFATLCNIASCGLTSFISPITAIVGMVLGSSAKKKSAAAGFVNKKAKVGFILSLVTLILGILGTVIGLIFVFFGGGMSLMANGLNSL